MLESWCWQCHGGAQRRSACNRLHVRLHVHFDVWFTKEKSKKVVFCVPDVIGGLILWRHNKPKTKNHVSTYNHAHMPLHTHTPSSGSATVPGTSRSPYNCAPLVCVLNFTGGLAVWRVLKQTNKQIACTKNQTPVALLWVL